MTATRKRSGTDELTPRQRKYILRLPDGPDEPTAQAERRTAPLKGTGPQIAAARRRGHIDAGPNHLLAPLNLLRERQRRGPLDQAAWERLVGELRARVPKDKFAIPGPVEWRHLGRPIAWAFQAINDLVTRGTPRRAGLRLLGSYLHGFDTKTRDAWRAFHALYGPAPTDAEVQQLIYAHNCGAARNLVMEFWNAPADWRRRLRICAWRHCQRVFIMKRAATTCRPACAASLSRERNRAI